MTSPAANCCCTWTCDNLAEMRVGGHDNSLRSSCSSQGKASIAQLSRSPGRLNDYSTNVSIAVDH